MAKEDNIRKLFGTKNPFCTPDGYLENLTDTIMSGIPDITTLGNASVLQMNGQDVHQSTFPRRTILYAVAASIAVLIVSILSFQLTTGEENNAPTVSKTYETLPVADGAEQMADYAMLANEDFYLYLTDN